MQTLRSVVLQLLVVAGGYGYGMLADYTPRPPNLFTEAGGVSVLLLGCSAFYAFRKECKKAHATVPVTAIACRTRGTWILLGLAFYAIILMFVDPFLFAIDYFALVKLVLVVPFLIALGHFAREGNAFAAWGSGLFAAAAIGMFVNNLRFSDTGAGFFSSWKS